MRSYFRLTLAVGLFLALMLPVPFAAAKASGQPEPQAYSLSIAASGNWNQNPAFSCPPQCSSNARFGGSGTLTYSNATFSSSMSVTISGNTHANWAGVNRNHPCTSFSSSIDLTTASHDKIHMQVSGVECLTFARGRWTGQNTLSGTYTITSGEGLFSQASGSGSVSGTAYPRHSVWSADAFGSIAFLPKGDE